MYGLFLFHRLHIIYFEWQVKKRRAPRQRRSPILKMWREDHWTRTIASAEMCFAVSCSSCASAAWCIAQSMPTPRATPTRSSEEWPATRRSAGKSTGQPRTTPIFTSTTRSIPQTYATAWRSARTTTEAPWLRPQSTTRRVTLQMVLPTMLKLIRMEVGIRLGIQLQPQQLTFISAMRPVQSWTECAYLLRQRSRMLSNNKLKKWRTLSRKASSLVWLATWKE